jgi:uncharacterized protein YndB with AHSA1/START domain
MPTVTVSRQLRVAIEAAYDAWLDEGGIARWLFRTPDGELLRCSVDARVGGEFEVTEQREDVTAVHRGRYTRLDRPRSLAFDFWVEPYAEGAMTQVLIELEPNAQGCELTLTHDGVWEGWEERTALGWAMILDGLAGEVE